MPKATTAATRAARRLVLLRDGMSCRRCGRSVMGRPSSVHHRINRGAGGSARLERASLLLRLCGDGTTGCHGWVTEHPHDAATLGYTLPKLNPDIDPEAEPLFTIDGWVLLDDAGEITPCDAPRAVAGDA